MTKEITKAYIIQQIEDKFKLRELVPSVFSFDETVVPVYNIEQHLIDWEVKFVTKSVTSGPTGFAFFTVPPEEKWTLYGYNVVFMAAGAYKVSGVYVAHSLTDIIYLDLKEGQTTSYSVRLPAPVVVPPKKAIKVYVDDYTSTADLRLYIHYSRETIR